MRGRAAAAPFRPGRRGALNRVRSGVHPVLRLARIRTRRLRAGRTVTVFRPRAGARPVRFRLGGFWLGGFWLRGSAGLGSPGRAGLSLVPEVTDAVRPGGRELPEQHEDQRERQRDRYDDHGDISEPAGQQQRQARQQPRHQEQGGQYGHGGEQDTRGPLPAGAAGGRPQREPGGAVQRACRTAARVPAAAAGRQARLPRDVPGALGPVALSMPGSRRRRPQAAGHAQHPANPVRRPAGRARRSPRHRPVQRGPGGPPRERYPWRRARPADQVRRPRYPRRLCRWPGQPP